MKLVAGNGEEGYVDRGEGKADENEDRVKPRTDDNSPQAPVRTAWHRLA